MSKKGFTLIELLAVISILGIMVLIALPNIVDAFNKSKENNFISEAQGVYKTAKNTYVLDRAKGYFQIAYVKGYPAPAGMYTKELDTTGRDEFKYIIKVNQEGDIYYFYVDDGDHKVDLGDANNPNVIVRLEDISGVTPTGLPPTITSSTTTTPSSSSNTFTTRPPVSTSKTTSTTGGAVRPTVPGESY